jgi:hypothetical protein
MNRVYNFLNNISANTSAKHTSFTVDPSPIVFFDPQDDIEFHASRLLFLIKFCGKELAEGQAIKGRTKLAKLDFFLRYPLYLERALKKLDRENLDVDLKKYEKYSIEAKMIRYKYGPWDSMYYDVFAYLVSKGLMVISPIGGVDHFILTSAGEDVVEQLLEEKSFNEMALRCRIIKKALGRRSGASLKNFIYECFPEIVQQPVGSVIEGVYDA